MKHAILLLAILCSTTASAITRSELADYAKSLKGKKKEELKTAVHQLIGSPKTLSYGSGYQKTWWGFYNTDRNEETNECINRYSANKFYFKEDIFTAVSGMDIEHSFPKSWWGGGTNSAYKDLYNLYPSDKAANSSKSNYPMGVVENVTNEEPGYDKVGTGTIDGKPGKQCWEPGNQYKGDFARSYMYMATAYQNLNWNYEKCQGQLINGAWPTLKEWAYKLYLKWLKNDPVDELEAKRNNAVASIQHNRNLFVDYPYLAEYIWGDSIDVAFDPYTAITTASDDNRYTGVPITDDDDDDTPVVTPDDDMAVNSFVETFDKCIGTGGNDGTFDGASANFIPDNEGWTSTASYGGNGCARFGKSKVKGTVTTPPFKISGTTTLTFKAAPYGNDGTSLTLSVNGKAELSGKQLTMKQGQWTTYTLTLTGQGVISITFSPSDRLFLDDVMVFSEMVAGDVDGDGELTTADVTDIYKIIVGKLDKDDYEEEAADIDKDGELTIADIVEIIKLLIGGVKE